MPFSRCMEVTTTILSNCFSKRSFREPIGIEDAAAGARHIPPTSPGPLLLLTATARPHWRHLPVLWDRHVCHGAKPLRGTVRRAWVPTRATPKRLRIPPKASLWSPQTPRRPLLRVVRHGGWLGESPALRPLKGVLLRGVGRAGLLERVLLRLEGWLLRGVAWLRGFLRRVLGNPDPLTPRRRAPGRAGRSGGCKTPSLGTPPRMSSRGCVATSPPPAARHACAWWGGKLGRGAASAPTPTPTGVFSAAEAASGGTRIATKSASPPACIV